MIGTAARVAVLTVIIAVALGEAWKHTYAGSTVDASLLFVFAFVGFVVATISEYVYQTAQKRRAKLVLPRAQPEKPK
jgi:Co/Zn/Cd efflux system component